MGRAYSNDLRERVVRAVIKGGLSRHQAAAHFEVGISTAINWVQRFWCTGSNRQLFENRLPPQRVNDVDIDAPAIDVDIAEWWFF